jgi:hypothetical protein
LRNHCKQLRYPFPSPFTLLLVIAPVLLLLLLQYVPVYAAEISGESKTILRMGKTADDRNIYPLYEYLNLGIINETGGGSVSGNIGGWGRVDLRDRSTDRYTDADLQYGYVSYQGNKNNLLLNAGRQFVAEGAATERVDGVHLRGDLAGGFGAAVFIGAPVVVEPDFKGGNVIYGGRVTHSIPQYYTIGLSALRTDDNSSRIREESAIDLWFHPIKQVDVVGRSTYNSITSGWLEHAYMASFSPLQNLRFTADLSGINYKDYFYQTTTKVFSLKQGVLDPNEKVFTLGGGVDYTPVENVNLSADYKSYAYDIAGTATTMAGRRPSSCPSRLWRAWPSTGWTGRTQSSGTWSIASSRQRNWARWI